MMREVQQQKKQQQTKRREKNQENITQLVVIFTQSTLITLSFLLLFFLTCWLVLHYLAGKGLGMDFLHSMSFSYKQKKPGSTRKRLQSSFQ